MQVERGDRSSRALAGVALERDEDGRSPELFHDARRDDADDTGVPALFGEHDPVRLVEIEARHQLARANERRTVHLLPALVQLLEIPRERVRPMLIRGEQQLHTTNRVAETAHRIESGRENEPHAASGYGSSRAAGGPAHGPPARRWWWRHPGGGRPGSAPPPPRSASG